jgi:hypothetical protein
MKKLLFITLLIVAVLERTVWDLGPNIELVTTAIVLSSLYLNNKYTFWLTLIIMAVTDRLLGNTNIFVFTWSGFLIPALLFGFLANLKKGKILISALSGMGANLFFFVWTNFGVWALDFWGMYSKDLQGLIQCYLNALPFLKNQLISSIIFIPLGLLLIEKLIKPILINISLFPKIGTVSQQTLHS